MALPKSIGIKLFDDTFVPVLTEGEIKSKKLVLTTVKDNQEKAIIELYEGNSDKCINNEYLGKLVISIERETIKGEPGIEVHLRLSEDGMLYAKAWDSESKAQSEIRIEHSSSERIFPETLSDDEINIMGDKEYKKIESYSDDELLSDHEQDYPKKNNFFTTIRIILAVLIIILIIALIVFGIFWMIKIVGDSKNTTKTEITTTSDENKKIENQKKIDEENKKKAEEEARLAQLKKESELKENKPIEPVNVQGKKHYIRWGENLWNICRKYYKDPWYYPSLAEANNINHPRKIYAGTYMIIPAKSSLQRWDFKK